MNNKLFKCLHCGRNLGAPCAHRCKGNLRKRGLLFRHRVTNSVIGSKEAINDCAASLVKTIGTVINLTKPRSYAFHDLHIDDACDEVMG